jgi:hypothetical protein
MRAERSREIGLSKLNKFDLCFPERDKKAVAVLRRFLLASFWQTSYALPGEPILEICRD